MWSVGETLKGEKRRTGRSAENCKERNEGRISLKRGKKNMKRRKEKLGREENNEAEEWRKKKEINKIK